MRWTSCSRDCPWAARLAQSGCGLGDRQALFGSGRGAGRCRGLGGAALAVAKHFPRRNPCAVSAGVGETGVGLSREAQFCLWGFHGLTVGAVGSLASGT